MISMQMTSAVTDIGHGLTSHPTRKAHMTLSLCTKDTTECDQNRTCSHTYSEASTYIERHRHVLRGHGFTLVLSWTKVTFSFLRTRRNPQIDLLLTSECLQGEFKAPLSGHKSRYSDSVLSLGALDDAG